MWILILAVVYALCTLMMLTCFQKTREFAVGALQALVCMGILSFLAFGVANTTLHDIQKLLLLPMVVLSLLAMYVFTFGVFLLEVLIFGRLVPFFGPIFFGPIVFGFGKLVFVFGQLFGFWQD